MSVRAYKYYYACTVVHDRFISTCIRLWMVQLHNCGLVQFCSSSVVVSCLPVCNWIDSLLATVWINQQSKIPQCHNLVYDKMALSLLLLTKRCILSHVGATLFRWRHCMASKRDSSHCPDGRTKWEQALHTTCKMSDFLGVVIDIVETHAVVPMVVCTSFRAW